MKAVVVLAFATAALAAPAPAQGPAGNRPAQPSRTWERQVHIPPIPNFVIGHSQRQGTSQIVEWVPRGETVQRYSKIITLNSFRAPAGATPATVLADFARRYSAACPRTTVVRIGLGGGNSGIRMDCPRNPMTGKRETVFARAVSAYPMMAIVQYMTPYLTMPSEATFARDFLGRVSVR